MIPRPIPYTIPNLVYFIRPIGQDGPVKIGCSADPKSRLEFLMAWAPVPLEIVVTIPGNLTLERRIHGVFASSHSHREWFRPSPELERFMASLAAGTPIGDLIDLSSPLPRFRAKREWEPWLYPYMRYLQRVRWAFRPFLKPKGEGLLSPNDVDAILSEWSRTREPPSPDKIARLEEVIANPGAHAVPWSQKYPPRRVAA